MQNARPVDQKGRRGGGEETTGTEHREGMGRGRLRNWGVVEIMLRRVGRTKPVTMQCLLKGSKLHSAGTLRH